MRAFASATGQLWKYRVWQVLTAAAFGVSVAFFSMMWFENPWHLPFWPTTAFYFPICIVWFAWWASAMTCPKCKQKPVWHQMTHGSHRSFGARVVATAACPACGYDPTEGRAPNREEHGSSERAFTLVIDPEGLVPTHKADLERAEAAVRAGYPVVAPVLGRLIEWLQDCNWPVAHVLTPFLQSIGTPLVPHSRHVWTRFGGDLARARGRGVSNPSQQVSVGQFLGQSG
jgi:hypothetical protein